MLAIVLPATAVIVYPVISALILFADSLLSSRWRARLEKEGRAAGATGPA